MCVYVCVLMCMRPCVCVYVELETDVCIQDYAFIYVDIYICLLD